MTKPETRGMVILYDSPKYHQRRNERMYLNILIMVFCVVVIGVGIYAVLQMVRNSKKDGSNK